MHHSITPFKRSATVSSFSELLLTCAPDQYLHGYISCAVYSSHAIHKFFQDRGFVYVHTPIITSTDAEGAGEMFRITTLDMANPPRTDEGKIDYSQELFGKSSFLTVSGQLAVEAFCFAFRNVYTFGPTFRAENSNTARHANEFWMIEPEIAFADLNDDMALAQDMMKYILNEVMTHAPTNWSSSINL